MDSLTVEVETEVGTFTVPGSADLTFGQLTDYKYHLRDYERRMSGEAQGDSFSALIKALSCVVKGPIELLDIAGEPGDFTLLSLVDHVSRVQAQVYNLGDEIMPDICWNVEGERYETSPANWGIHASPHALKVIELIEVHAMRELSPNPDDIVRSEDLNTAFTLSLGQLALLLRKPNEQLPLDESERKLWLDERIQIMRHIPAQIALCVHTSFAFFLMRSLKTASSTSFGTGTLTTPTQAPLSQMTSLPASDATEPTSLSASLSMRA